jgi:hypothetical protein
MLKWPTKKFMAYLYLHSLIIIGGDSGNDKDEFGLEAHGISSLIVLDPFLRRA